MAIFASLLVLAFLVGTAGWLLLGWLRERRKRNAAIKVVTRFWEQRNNNMGKHDGHQAEAVDVVELLERAALSGQALRLNWSVEDTDPCELAAVSEQDEWPTGVLPRMTDELMDAIAESRAMEAAEQDAELPKRLQRNGIPAPDPEVPVWIQRDEEVLTRVLGGLRRLGQGGTQ